MGYIKEPEGIDFIVAPSTFTTQDRQLISNIIANYKKTRTFTKPTMFPLLQSLKKRIRQKHV